MSLFLCVQDVSESNLATLGIAPILNFLAKIFVFGYDFYVHIHSHTPWNMPDLIFST